MVYFLLTRRTLYEFALLSSRKSCYWQTCCCYYYYFSFLFYHIRDAIIRDDFIAWIILPFFLNLFYIVMVYAEFHEHIYTFTCCFSKQLLLVLVLVFVSVFFFFHSADSCLFILFIFLFCLQFHSLRLLSYCWCCL